MKFAKRQVGLLALDTSHEYADFTRNPPAAESGYLYHATHHYNAQDIKNVGYLTTHKPSHGTDQTRWPDGSKEKRSYWTHKPSIAVSFVPEGGNPALLRTKHIEHFKQERGTSDHYTNKKIPTHQIEYLHRDGSWRNFKE